MPCIVQYYMLTNIALPQQAFHWLVTQNMERHTLFSDIGGKVGGCTKVQASHLPSHSGLRAYRFMVSWDTWT